MRDLDALPGGRKDHRVSPTISPPRKLENPMLPGLRARPPALS
jgi:hypothetical protein